ncbi:MAG TPA: alpha/beta fold hydrolase, partial [Puia sp.]
MNRKILSLCLALVLSLCAGVAFAQDNGGEGVYQDLTHYSKVFGHEKYYRLYLPQGYAGASRKYPVIYFFHGWGGRHFKDDNAKLEYVKIKKLVDRYQVILVMWDGNIELSEPRPYNVGNHEDVKFQTQMKDYFPELVTYIDSSYRTLTDRAHRGIIGFSMGGFMSFFLAGKYPDKVPAAVSLAGSPEFFVGYPDNQELYPMRYAFPNLRQVATRMHNGNTDILYYLNSEVHAGALWDEKVNLEYWTFPGGHMIDRPGETVVFEKAMKFVTDAFKKPNGGSQAANWSHYDLYPDFNVWGYQVESDKREPGFLNLDNVDKNGFRFCTRRWLPDGPSLDEVQAHITTAPLYMPNTVYGMATYHAITDAVTVSSVLSDTTGRISVKCDGAGGGTGIFSENDAPEFVFLDYSTGQRNTAHVTPPTYYSSLSRSAGAFSPAQVPAGQRMLAVAADDQLFIRLFNRGGEVRNAQQIRVRIYTKDPSVRIKDSIVTFTVLPGQRIAALPPLVLSCSKTPPPHAEPADIRFHLAISGTNASDEFIVPVFFKADVFDSIRVDDGRLIRDTILGEGNGDGITDAGERILLYQGSHRLRVYT